MMTNRQLLDERNRLRGENEVLRRQIASLLTVEQLEAKFERFVRDTLADYDFRDNVRNYEVGDNGDKPKIQAPINQASIVGWHGIDKPTRVMKKESSVTEPQPIATGVDKGRAIWQKPININRPAAHVKHDDGYCEVCQSRPCRCSKEF